MFYWERYFELWKYSFILKKIPFIHNKLHYSIIHVFVYMCKDTIFPVLFNELYTVIVYFDA